jgi:hypothetical protein
MTGSVLPCGSVLRGEDCSSAPDQKNGTCSPPKSRLPLL